MADAVTDAYHRLFGGETNLSFKERGISLALGLGLAAAGVKPRPNPFLNVLALAGGAYLALRGASGHCPIKAALDGGTDQSRIAGGESRPLVSDDGATTNRPVRRSPLSRAANNAASASGAA
jgi:uncharacterized membrane protein